MKVSDILNVIRPRIADENKIEYEDEELIEYLNDAMDFLSAQLIAMNDSGMITDLTVKDGNAVPADFMDKYAGNFPVYISGDAFKILDGSTQVDIRYYAMKPHVVRADDLVPFKDYYKSVLTQAVAMYALNRNEYEIGQDKGLLNDLLTAHAAAKK